jgi:hypothetical protein
VCLLCKLCNTSVKTATAFPPAGFPLDYSLRAEDVVINQPILSVANKMEQKGEAPSLIRAARA